MPDVRRSMLDADRDITGFCQSKLCDVIEGHRIPAQPREAMLLIAARPQVQNRFLS